MAKNKPQRHSLVGQRFGKLLALERIPEGQTKYRCLCDCGKEVTVARGSLQQGVTRSCGCLRSPDLIGQKFHRLTVLALTRKMKQGRKLPHYICRCDCGNEHIVDRTDLTKGRVKSCGCLRGSHYGTARPICKGDHFGRLTVVAQAGKGEHLCNCSCGGTKIVPYVRLRAGSVQSCGCLRGSPLPWGQAAQNAVFLRNRKNAQLRGLSFTLIRNDTLPLFKQNCYDCGAPPTMIYKHPRGNCIYNGLDRVDNTEGYTPSNVVPCCWKCNRAKREATREDFLNWVMLLHDPIPPISASGLARVVVTPKDKQIYRKYQGDATRRGISFSLDLTPFAALIQSNCGYCGTPPASRYRKHVYTGIDRVDNVLGYAADNCVPACIRCNRAKNTDELADFLAWAKRIQTFQTTAISTK